MLRLLTDRRDEPSRSRGQGLNRLHRLMTELVPGGIPVKKSVPQYQTMLARLRPRDLVGRTVRRLAADQLADLVRLDVRLKALKAELTQAVLATGSHLMDLHGIGPAGAARILADVADVRPSSMAHVGLGKATEKDHRAKPVNHRHSPIRMDAPGRGASPPAGQDR